MLHTILLACCISQFTVSVEKPLQSFTVQTEKPTVKEYDDYYVVMFSASWCGPCRNYKETGQLDRLINGGARVVLVDIDTDSNYYSGRVPRFWICKNKIRAHEFPEGAVAPEVILQKIKSMSEKDVSSKPAVRKSSIYNGRPNNSHTNRESLIDHLMTGSVHQGKHSLNQLEKMSDVDLDNLHNSDHTTR